MRNEGPNPEKGNGPVSSSAATNPNGGAERRRVAGKPVPKQDLLERILSRPNMLKAWERVKANKGAPGIDNMPVDDLMAYVREHWDNIRASLLAGTYQPSKSTLICRLNGWKSINQRAVLAPWEFPPC